MNYTAFAPGTVVTLLPDVYNDDNYKNTLYDNDIGSLKDTKFTIVGPVSTEEFKAKYTKEVEITLPRKYIQQYNSSAPRTTLNRAREAISTSAQTVANRASGASTAATNAFRGLRNTTQTAWTGVKHKLGARLFVRPRKLRRTRKNRR